MIRIIKYIIPVILIENLIAQTQIDIEWPTLANSDWPMIKHDPQFTGRSPYKGPQTPTIIWTADMKDGIFSGPVIGKEGNLYFGSYYQLDSADHFYSYSPDGNLIWDYKLETNRPPQSGILIDSSNTIYFGSLDGYFYALYPDGTLKWKYLTSNPIVELAMPNIDKEGRLYITNGLGELYSFNPDGTLNWSIIYDGGFFARSPVFSPDGNTIYIAGKDSNLFALNLDGTLKWKFSCGKTQKFPIIDNDSNLYILPEEVPQKLYSIKPDGMIRWEVTIVENTAIPAYSASTIDYLGNIYVALGSAILSYDYYGNKRWWYIIGNDPSEYDDFWQPLICDSEGTVYVGSTFGYYYYAISSDGELKWKLPLNDYQVDNTGAISKDGTLYIGVHKSSLSPNQQKTLIAIRDTGTVSVKDNFKFLDYHLEQNYPNPFNPNTTINYSIKERGLVHLKVYNVLGKEITTLVDEEKSQGSYSVSFDGSNLPSGVYVYSIRVNNFIQNRKMILMK
jgi:outer membrane protein assembly factor BamB